MDTQQESNSREADIDFVLSLNKHQMDLLVELLAVAVAGVLAEDSFDNIANRLWQVAKLSGKSQNVRRDFRHMGVRFRGQIKEPIRAAI